MLELDVHSIIHPYSTAHLLDETLDRQHKYFDAHRKESVVGIQLRESDVRVREEE